MTKILFLQGHGSQPGGIIPDFLRQQGYEVVELDLPAEDFDEALKVAQEAFAKPKPDLIVGYSRGGAVAMNMDAASAPRVLIAPAWRTQGQATTVGPDTNIVHSENDGVVPIEDSKQLLEQSGLSESHLVVAGEDHSMFDKAALEAILKAVQLFG